MFYINLEHIRLVEVGRFKFLNGHKDKLNRFIIPLASYWHLDSNKGSWHNICTGFQFYGTDTVEREHFNKTGNADLQLPRDGH